MIIERFEPVFYGAIRTMLGSFYSQGGKGKIRRQLCPKFLAEIGHIVELKSMLLPKPFIHLCSAEFRFTYPLHIFRDLRFGKRSDVSLFCFHEAAKIISIYGQ